MMDMPQDDPPIAPSLAGNQRGGLSASDGARVLIVDDTQAKLTALTAIIASMGLEVVTATSGEQALRTLLKQDFAVILLDVNMPTMDGFETAELIRSRQRTEHTPIIFVTAEANSEGERLSGYKLGAVDFICSPIVAEILRAKVRVFVDLYTIQRQVVALLEHQEDLVKQRTAALTSEIAERKRAEEKVKRLNRIHAVLSGISNAIVRINDRQKLLAEGCRIAVEQGQFRMAWIGLRDPGVETVTPMARAGFDDGYLDNFDITLTNGSHAEMHGPGLRALREKAPVVCNDIEADPTMMPWRADAVRRGYRSLVAFPLTVGANEVVGLFALYAAERDFFDAEQMSLLGDVAGELSFALDHIEKEEKLNYLAYYDVTTGLPNRTLFHDRVGQHLVAARESGTIVALLKINVEQLRVVNDTLGRHAGNTLLKQFAERLVDVGLTTSHLAYTGFRGLSVVLDNLQQAADAAHFLESRIIDSLRHPFVVEGIELRISTKTGIALFPSDGTDAETLSRNAAAAMERAKSSMDRYLFYTPEINARVAENLSLENKLRQALDKDQFVLHYQPKVDLATRTIIGLEALIRWQSPELGLVPPLKFIPLLEATGMILEVGAWVLRRAVLDHRHWLELGLAAPRIAVNVSMIQLRQREFVDSLNAAIGGDGASSGIDLEITESLIMDNVKDNITKLQTVRAMGMGVAIDDFGTGYSSLAYLAKLPVETLKIDRAFIIPLLKDANARTLVRTMISLAHSLGMRVVAEGVEEEEQAAVLQAQGCDEMQGYLFSKPLPREEMTKLLQRA